MKRLLLVLLVLSAATLSAWEYTTTEDLMAGTVSRVAMLEAAASQGTVRSPALIIRQGATLEAFVHWGGYSVDRDLKNAFIRIGEDDAFGWRVNLSQSREATFFHDAMELLRQLDGRVVMLVTSATGRDMVGLWEVTDIMDVLAALDVSME